MRISIIIFSILVFSACPDEPSSNNNDENNTIFNPSNGTTNKNNTTKGPNNNNGTTNNKGTTPTNGGSDDGKDYGAGCDGIVCEDVDQRCVRGSCINKSFKIACFEAQDLGVLDITQTKTASGDTKGFADSLSFECSQTENGFSGPENAIQFQLSADANVKIDLSSTSPIDWAMDLRTNCHDPSTSVLCQDPETLSFPGKAGETYTIVVEPRSGIDEGTFNLDFEFTASLCSPAGSYSCDGDNLTRCVAGGAAVQNLACPAGCSDAACIGNTCSEPIVVTASTTFSGDSAAYTNVLDFGAQPTCSPDAVSGISSPGSEVILSLPNLTAGQKVVVDTSMNDENDNAIFVLETCSDQDSCLAGVDLGEKLDWDVPSNGDYFIVIDKITNNPKTFNYIVDIQ